MAEPGPDAVEIGIFARVFPAGPPAQVATAIRAAGFRATQLNLSAVGRPTLDQSLSAGEAADIAEAFAVAGVRIWGVSGTFNAIHPDPSARAAGVAGCRAVIARAPELGAEMVTLCTGTRDPEDMWRSHPDNTSAAAWADLRATLDELIPAAADAGVRLGIEPEPGNVVVDAASAHRLLRELGDDARHLAVVLDPANLLTSATLDRQESILRAAFDRLGPAVAAVHAKDVRAPGAETPSRPTGLVAAGHGAMAYDLILELHATLPQRVPVIAQDLTPDDARRVHDFLADAAARAAGIRQTEPAS
jgi:sugar phosphate isomerase/epimerase